MGTDGSFTYTPAAGCTGLVTFTYQADNGLGQFDCTIRAGDAVLASAQVTVFGPEDPVAFLKGENP